MQCMCLQDNRFVYFQVLSAVDILQPPHIDFFQEVYPFHLYLFTCVCFLRMLLSVRKA